MPTLFTDRKLDEELQLSGVDAKGAEQAFGDLTGFFNLPIEKIAAEYWRYRANEDVIAQQKVATAVDEKPVHEYYASTPHYLYELSYWEASGDKQGWFEVLYQACKRLGVKRVLDFGGGVGGVSLYMSARGMECGHVDVPGKTREYAMWRFAQHKRQVEVLDATKPETWPAGKYDAVIAWDVLEHLFDLEGAIANIARLLRQGGHLFNKSTFADCGGNHIHIHLAKHACYHDLNKFNELILSNGFRFVGQLKPSRLSRAVRQIGFRNAVVGVQIAPRLKHGGNFLVHIRH